MSTERKSPCGDTGSSAKKGNLEDYFLPSMPKGQVFDAATVKSSAQNRWHEILVNFGMEQIFLTNKHGPCPFCGGTDRWRWDNKDGNGNGICGQCGAGDGFYLVGNLLGLDPKRDFSAIATQVAEFLGMAATREGSHKASPRPLGLVGNFRRNSLSQAAQAASQPDPKAWSKMQAVGRDVVPLSHPVAEPGRLYMAHRGLVRIMDDLPDPTVFGFHAGLEYWDDKRLVGTYPALVARIQAPNGATVNLHRTYLTTDGHKAPVPEPKKLMVPIYRGATRGGAIRLYSATDTLSVTEGTETALAVRLGTGQPVWSTITAGGMEHLLLPDTTRFVNVWSDLDLSGTGQRVAEALARRLTREGRAVRVCTPPGQIPDGAKGVDWLDVFNATRRAV